ncbi:uncharacterized protein NPIL_89911 [Nephila pilipes]|uniref:Uncharacterized protein n=1 Tax=Nephila pilipes TaxID=299642 RepID=A0A8X6N135_NEPPI|nr:uncharacterized protein NPIL_89911 [Nephila pilipes]
MEKTPEAMYKACAILPDCLCNLDLPHTDQHAYQLPPYAMPTLHFPSEREEENEKTKRIRELLADMNGFRTQDTMLKQKFEKRADQLMTELKSVPQTPQWLPKEDRPLETSGDRLKYELEQSRFQLAEIRNQMHSLKKELMLYRKLVRQEVGGCYDLHHLMVDKQWRGRAEEIERLKSEIAQMESKAYGHKYLRNPITIPQYNPHFPRIEDLIPKRQVECLQKEAIMKKEDTEGKQATILIQEYGNLALMHKASATHNKILAVELRSLKEQLDQLEIKSKEDLELIKNLTTHQIQMRELFDREAHLATLVRQNEDEKADAKAEEKLESGKYKALWEVSEYQKQSLYEMVRLLAERLDGVMKKAEEAEKHCLDNQERKQELEKELETQKETRLASAKAAKAEKVKKAVAGGETLPVEGQLEAVREENTFLKNFLSKAIEVKEEDLKLYRFTMKSIRSQYLEAMEKIKNEIEAKKNEKEATPAKKR